MGNYTLYGRRGLNPSSYFSNVTAAKGYSPADKQDGKWFTEDVVNQFEKNKISATTSVAIAQAWVDAVATIVTQYKFKEENNTFNAVAIGVDKSVTPNVVKVFGIEMTKINKEYSAAGKEIASCTILP